MAPLFFFSYARADYNRSLQKFYDDLSAQIGLSEHVPGQAGYFDRDNLQAGDYWDIKLKEALEISKSLVFVCSPAYLASDYCGKEFQACLDRQETSGGSSTALIPVIWGEPRDSLHPSIQRLHYTFKKVPPAYEQYGLSALIRLRKHREAYNEFIIELARVVVDAIRKHPLPHIYLPSLKSIKNHFQAATLKRTSNNRQAIFSFVVGRPDELKRAEVERYGELGKDWRPFHPTDSDPVGIVAMGVAVRQKLHPKELEIGSELVSEIQKAEQQGDLVILLVDPWTVRIQRYWELMRAYDKINFENSAVLVAWNSPDAETDRTRSELEQALRTAFRYKAGQKSIYYSDRIRSPHELKSTLAKTLTRLRNRLIESGTITAPIQDEALASAARAKGIALDKQPVVNGPGEVR